MLNISDVRMFNSLNLSMSLVSTGGFIPTNSLESIIKSNTQKIIFLAGTGIWTEFVGAECTGAYSGAQESHFMWKGKCKVPDSVMENAKNRMINFKKENWEVLL